jgi:hypothetical protein
MGLRLGKIPLQDLIKENERGGTCSRYGGDENMYFSYPMGTRGSFPGGKAAGV